MLELRQRVKRAQLGDVQPVVRGAGGVRERMGIQVVEGPTDRSAVEPQSRRERGRTGVEGVGCFRRRAVCVTRSVRDVVQAEERGDPAVQHVGRRIGWIFLEHRPLSGEDHEWGLGSDERLQDPVGELEELAATEYLRRAHEQAARLSLRKGRIPGRLERKGVRHREAICEQPAVVGGPLEPVDRGDYERQLLRISELQGAERKLNHGDRVGQCRIRGDLLEICESLVERRPDGERLRPEVEVIRVGIQLRARRVAPRAASDLGRRL